MPYQQILEAKLKEFDEKFVDKQMDINGNLAYTELNDLSDADDIKSFLTTFAEKIRESVVGEVKSELLKRMMKYDSKDGYSTLHDEIIEKVYNDVEDITSSTKR